MMQRLHLFFGLALAGSLLMPLAADEPPLAGYSAESSRAERQWEEKFRAIPSPDVIRETMKRLSARPHNVGSPYDKENAEWIAARMKEWGLETQIESFEVLYPTPKERLVELVAPTQFTAKLQEPALSVDPTSNQQSEQLPTYNGYSIDGDVTAPLVYVNYGIPKDYEDLERMGVSVKGAIVIARYGASWRGIKVKVAGEHGAIGCLIYSDPKDDGYSEGVTFPAGAWRPKDGVQRGSVADMPLYSGDPLTPGVAATHDAKRLPINEAPTITKIPVLPISYGDAQPLLASLEGPVAPANWRGALPITYRVGPGPGRVHLKLKSNWDLKPLYDVIGRIPGSVYPDEWIVRGNHHDAWVNGAEDPISGQSSMLEEARALGELLKSGWKPKRTIIYCAWDGEEPGLLGSTEWVEAHVDELRQRAAVYINSDSNTRGYLEIGGSHSLEKFINDVARGIDDPEKHVSVWKRDQLAAIAHANSPEERQEARGRADLRIEALGSGSDWTPFLQFAGIASLNLGYGGEDGGGIYHSVYDDFYWYTHFADTEFVYGRALAQTAGIAVMRLADADLLPFEFADFADTIQKYVRELEKLSQDQREEIRERNLEIEEGVFTATADPKKPYVPPSVQPLPPFVNFSPLENAADALTRSAKRYKEALAKSDVTGGGTLAAAALAEVNRLLLESERKLILDDGLPGRSWYKHQIYAPGLYTGYGVKTIPGVREAIEQKKWDEANAQITRVAKVLEAEAALINSAAAKLAPAAQ
ncbi:MAG: transferrin receptor-like dimerization domain-containing protein [Candidatus Acidiferrales bacterium]